MENIYCITKINRWFNSIYYLLLFNSMVNRKSWTLCEVFFLHPMIYTLKYIREKFFLSILLYLSRFLFFFWPTKIRSKYKWIGEKTDRKIDWRATFWNNSMKCIVYRWTQTITNSHHFYFFIKFKNFSLSISSIGTLFSRFCIGRRDLWVLWFHLFHLSFLRFQ